MSLALTGIELLQRGLRPHSVGINSLVTLEREVWRNECKGFFFENERFFAKQFLKFVENLKSFEDSRDSLLLNLMLVNSCIESCL